MNPYKEYNYDNRPEIAGRGNLLERTKKTDGFWCPECFTELKLFAWVDSRIDYGAGSNRCRCGYRYNEKDEPLIKEILKAN